MDSPAANPPNQSSNNRLRNLLVSIAAIILTTAVFFGFSIQTSSVSLEAIAATAVPIDTALANTKPTVIEFYADWCTSCQSMAPDNKALQQQYGDRVNFVMLNVDNNKWLPEVTRFKVDGIPHFVFLDRGNQTIGNAIGTMPKQILAANIDAMIALQTLPYNKLDRGQTSEFAAPLPADATDPRSHG